jgi:hypothetical protein
VVKVRCENPGQTFEREQALGANETKKKLPIGDGKWRQLVRSVGSAIEDNRALALVGFANKSQTEEATILLDGYFIHMYGDRLREADQVTLSHIRQHMKTRRSLLSNIEAPVAEVLIVGYLHSNPFRLF